MSVGTRTKNRVKGALNNQAEHPARTQNTPLHHNTRNKTHNQSKQRHGHRVNIIPPQGRPEPQTGDQTPNGRDYR